VIGIRDAAVHRTDSGALRGIEMTHAFCALLAVDDVNLITGRDGLVWAFGLTGSAIDAFFGDLICHITLLLIKMKAYYIAFSSIYKEGGVADSIFLTLSEASKP
jgi:hypothetical protein